MLRAWFGCAKIIAALAQQVKNDLKMQMGDPVAINWIIAKPAKFLAFGKGLAYAKPVKRVST